MLYYIFIHIFSRYLFDYEQHQREKEKKLLGEGKKCTKSEKSTKHARNSSVNAAGKSKDEIQSKSDSDKDSKELNPSDHNKLLTHGKPSRGGKAKNKGEITKAKAERIKSLKTPNSPKLHPKSPCSPKSLSSVGASGSTGCPSPSENVCDSSEVRTKTEQAACCDMTKDDKNVRKATDLMDMKEDDSNKEEVKDQNGTAKNVKNTLSDVTKKETKEKAFRNDRRSTKDIESSNKDKNEEEKRRNDKMEVMMDDVKKEDVEEEEEEKMKEESGAEMEDAVDVVNSPSGASDSVDGDEEYVKRADKKSAGQAEDKSEVSGELGGKQDGCIDVDGLEYKLNDRIDVRYGRGRNATVYQAKVGNFQ